MKREQFVEYNAYALTTSDIPGENGVYLQINYTDSQGRKARRIICKFLPQAGIRDFDLDFAERVAELLNKNNLIPNRLY